MEDRERLLQKALDGELSEREDAEFSRLLEEDEELREEYTALEGLKQEMASMPRLDPPEGLKEKVMAQIPGGGWFSFLTRPILTLTPATTALVAAILIAAVVLLKPGPATVDQTAGTTTEEVLVRFAMNNPEAKSVSLVGNFNNWKTGQLPMIDEAGDGKWKVTVALKPGVYEYMFVVDGKKWIVDPNADFVKDDGFGRTNGILEI